jgi:hypothetical protein
LVTSAKLTATSADGVCFDSITFGRNGEEFLGTTEFWLDETCESGPCKCNEYHYGSVIYEVNSLTQL